MSALDKLKTDKIYKSEYEQFVTSMSYADEDERISFDDALCGLDEIIEMYLSTV